MLQAQDIRKLLRNGLNIPRLTPSPRRRITEAPGCHTNSQRMGRCGRGERGGGRKGGFRTLLEEGKFSFLPSFPPRPLGFLRTSPLRTSLSIPTLETWWPNHVLCHRSRPFSRHHRRDGRERARKATLSVPGFPGSASVLVAAQRAPPPH